MHKLSNQFLTFYLEKLKYNMISVYLNILGMMYQMVWMRTVRIPVFIWAYKLKYKRARR